jgi:hypothetical protein
MIPAGKKGTAVPDTAAAAVDGRPFRVAAPAIVPAGSAPAADAPVAFRGVRP